MLWDMIQVIVLTITFMYVYLQAPTARVRRLSLLPLAAVVMDLLAAGLINPLAMLPLTALLAVSRAVLVMSCVKAVRAEKQRMRKRQRRAAAAIVALPSSVHQTKQFCA